MSLLLLLTGGSGFLCSFVLLRAGLSQMWLRYPLAIITAYCVFLLLLRLWLGAQRRWGESHGPDANLSGLDIHPGGAVGKSTSPDFGFGGGGDFGGGGAGGSWVQAGGLTPQGGGGGVPVSGGGGISGSGGRSSFGDGLFDSLDIDLDFDFGDEGCAVFLALLALLAALVAGLAVSFYVVWAAPALLAEILVDGLLVAGLYKRMKGVERRHWLRAAVRKTWLPVALTLASFGAAGYAMQRAVPEARSVGEFWQLVTSD